MKKTCKITSKEFEIAEEELKFLERMDVPLPEFCPEERTRLRMLYGNHRHLFIRKCDATGKKIVTNYPPTAKNPVYEISHWWSDKWDQHASAIDFDFSKSFFEQFKGLMEAAPRPSTHRAYQFDENSDYTNYAGQNKNCYLIFDSDLCRDCLYSYSINNCNDVLDCFRVEKSELCYECIDCTNCYSSSYLQNCETCSDSHFLKNCISCSHCFGCVNMKNKRFCFFNEQLDEKQYREKFANFNLASRKTIASMRSQYWDYVKQFPFKAVEGYFNENSIGSYISNCKNAVYCYDSRELWDCRYIEQAFGDCKDCIDCVEVGQGAELLYDTAYSGFPARFLRFSSHCYPNCTNLTYCYHCPSSHNCFACVGLHNRSYCIFNRQYTETQYKEMLEKICKHLKSTGEWGKPLPPELSPFPYNMSAAQDYYPLTKEQALSRKYNWLDPDPKEYQKSDYTIPDTIDEVDEAILNIQLCCKETGKNFKLQRAELLFYKKLGIPVPDLHPDQRFLKRLNRRNPRKLYKTKCSVSNQEIYTSVPKEWGVQIVSQDVFLEKME